MGAALIACSLSACSKGHLGGDEVGGQTTAQSAYTTAAPQPRRTACDLVTVAEMSRFLGGEVTTQPSRSGNTCIDSPSAGVGDQAISLGPVVMIPRGEDLISISLSGVDDSLKRVKLIYGAIDTNM
jgi:hypothetical protein